MTTKTTIRLAISLDSEITAAGFRPLCTWDEVTAAYFAAADQLGIEITVDGLDCDGDYHDDHLWEAGQDEDEMRAAYWDLTETADYPYTYLDGAAADDPRLRSVAPHRSG